MLAKYDNLEGVTASDIMGNNPRILDADILAVDAGNIMQENKITQLIITGDHSYIGMVHLHDLYQHGIIA
jgi:arabinose-5-phosphate isomerase